MNGANCADCEATWPVPSLLCSASMMSISGAPRPTLLAGPGWSPPGQVQALAKGGQGQSVWEGRGGDSREALAGEDGELEVVFCF